MIRLDLSREPRWLDLGHGVRVHVGPCSSALVMAARAAVVRGANTQPDEQAASTLTATFVKTLAKLAVDATREGVGGADSEPAAISPDAKAVSQLAAERLVLRSC